jgi:hypothetical protein
MENSLHIAEPVALVRPRGAHRFEGFSPKLARRLTFYRRGLLEQWLLFEADPAVIVFCERPGCVNVSGKERLADFGVRYVDRQELVILDDTFDGDHATKSHRHLDEAALPIRKVSSPDLAAARVWIDNWQRMLPCIVVDQNKTATDSAIKTPIRVSGAKTHSKSWLYVRRIKNVNCCSR